MKKRIIIGGVLAVCAIIGVNGQVCYEMGKVDGYREGQMAATPKKIVVSHGYYDINWVSVELNDGTTRQLTNSPHEPKDSKLESFPWD